MNKKGKKEIIFSNDTYRQQQTYNSQASLKIRNFEFKYGFREYLRFSLCKLILRNDTGVTFIPENGMIIGEQTKCKALINQIQDEVNRFKVKSVKFNVQHDIDEIEYWLDEDVKVFRPGVIEVALKNLQKQGLFLEECDNFRRKMLNENFILVRIPRQKVESTTELIVKIVNDKARQSNDCSRSQSYLNSELSMTQTNLNITSNMMEEIKSQASSTLNQSLMQHQAQQQSYSITQNNQSLYNESFNIYYIRKGQKNQKYLPA